MIEVQNLVGGYSNSPIIQGVNLEIKKGEFFTLLGPNGSGKTTLFKLITGQLPKKAGSILLDGKEISSYSKLAKAKKVAVLSQESSVSFDYTVDEIVSLGRYPHQKGILKNLTREDRKIIDEVMEITKVSKFRKKQFRMISGGEKQRVLLAKALVQEPELLLLDEPTNHLDIKHTFQLLDLLKERQLNKGLTIFSILHDLNVASLYADRFALLNAGQILEVGDVELLRKEEQLQRVYQVQVNAQSHPTVPKPQLLMTPNYATTDERLSFEKSYEIKQDNHSIHVEFKKAIRTISNCDLGEGIQWLKHFCHVYVPEFNHLDDSKLELEKWMENKAIPYEQSAGLIRTENLEDLVILEEMGTTQMMVVVTIGNANGGVPLDPQEGPSKRTINIMLFIDAHFTDGALVNGAMLATEGKMKALQDVGGTAEFSSSQDTLLLGLTQQGEKFSSTDAQSELGKGIRQLVYRATQKAMRQCNKQLQFKGGQGID